MPIHPEPANRKQPAIRILLKVVPGSRRNEIVGRLGDRLKLKVAMPPEDGKANDAVRELLAAVLGVRPNAITLVAGHTNPEKTVLVVGVSPEDARRRLGL